MRRGEQNAIPRASSMASSYHLPGAPAPSGPSPLPLSLPRGLLKGCVGDGNHHRDTSSCCRVSGSLFQSLYFRISAGNWGSGSHRGRRTCVSTRRCRSCSAGVIAPSSSRPWGRLRHLRQRRLCGNVISAFRSSRVHVQNSFTITALLLDRSLGNRGCVGHKIVVICTEPQHL
jgi:hypothetical protein